MATPPTSQLTHKPLSTFIANDHTAITCILSYNAEYRRLLQSCLDTLGGAGSLTTELPAGLGGVGRADFAVERMHALRYPRVARDLLAEAVAAVEALP